MSSFNLGTVQDVSFNGVPMGYSKIHLNGVRIWEKYQVNTPYQVWVSEGHNETVNTYEYHSGDWSNYVQNGSNASGPFSSSVWQDTLVSGNSQYSAWGPVFWSINIPSIQVINARTGIKKLTGSSTSWVDTSYYETQYQMIDTWYY
jgi:hypothetical protein